MEKLLAIYANGKLFQYLHNGQDKVYVYHSAKGAKIALTQLKKRYPDQKFEIVPYVPQGKGDVQENIDLYNALNDDSQLTEEQAQLFKIAYRMGEVDTIDSYRTELYDSDIRIANIPFSE